MVQWFKMPIPYDVNNNIYIAVKFYNYACISRAIYIVKIC